MDYKSTIRIIYLIGVVFSIFYGIGNGLIYNQTFPIAFLKSAKILFWWFVVLAGIMGVYVLSMVVEEISRVIRLKKAKKLSFGKIVFEVLVGIITFSLVVLFVICPVFGAYLLKGSITSVSNGVVWETGKLILGTGLIIIGYLALSS